MYIFNLITLLGGLSMFLYGMRLMGNSLKEGSSGTLKKAMEKIDSDREKRSNELIIKEKLETVEPMIESGLVYNVLLQ